MEKPTEFPILPILPLRGLVIFPNMLLHFDVGRKRSVAALNAAMKQDQMIFLVAQQDVREDEPDASRLCSTGCVAQIRQVLQLPGDVYRVFVEGISRGVTLEIKDGKKYLSGAIRTLAEHKSRAPKMEREALTRRLREAFGQYAMVAPKLPPEVVFNVESAEEPGELADYIAYSINAPAEEKQKILDQLHPMRRAEAMVALLLKETELLALEQEINDKVHEQMDENQKEYYLREQMRVISEELGEAESPLTEAEKYRERINRLDAASEVKDKLFEETDKLMKMPYGSHEATVVRGYLDFCLSLPWNKQTRAEIDLSRAEKILNAGHYGLGKVKERILEMLAVRRLNPDISGQIICLVGPPGVGKTSIARSIAEAMGRKYARVSLGGVRDEADIRGHRKTYVGAMPGRILSAIRQAGVSNPLLLFDEVDKLGSDFRGDPSSALLEALDGEQNNTFVDHYLEIPYDLSHVVFLTTANTVDTIPAPLLDRMEVIPLSTYTPEEKFHIAKKHLIPKQRRRHGLDSKRLAIRDGAVRLLISGYSREAGVRELERQIASLCRKAAKRIVEGKSEHVTVTEKTVREMLGAPKYLREELSGSDEIGVCSGLAWTSAGGELLKVEAAVMPGSGKLELTGSLGDVMKESARAAVTLIRSHAESWGVPQDFYKTKDIHIHAPEGAVPKDGPSAGVTMCTALVSALTGVPVRSDVAMTGEITLLGRVLPIGGLKEKSMAAYNAGISTVLIPKKNLPDLEELDGAVKEHIRFVPAEDIRTVLRTALVRDVTAEEAPAAAPAPILPDSGEPAGIRM